MPLLLRDSTVENTPIISGYSACLAYAEDSEALIEGLKQGRSLSKTPWFSSDEVAKKCGMEGNCNAVRLTPPVANLCTWVENLMTRALDRAKLDKLVMEGDNVRVYLTGLGPRVEASDYRAFYHHNDVEDVTLNTSLHNLHVINMSSDKLANHLARAFKLKYLPPNLHCTSNSSLSAVHLGIQAIESGQVDLVMVINCSFIKTQDIRFLISQSILNGKVVQPFGATSKSVLLAEGGCALLLESARHRGARKLHGGIKLASTYAQISAGRGNDASQLSASLLKVMNKSISKTQITVEELGAIIPHANGSEVSDKAEGLALLSFIAENTVPVLAYKGQIGYTATGSGIIDLIIGHHSLCTGELLSPVGNDPVKENVAHLVMLNKGIIKHTKQHLLKIGLGVDGSIIGVVMSDNRQGI